MNRTISRIAAVFFTGLFLAAPGALPCKAQGSGGTGGGSGGNAGVALTLVSSSVKDGAKNVPLNPTIDLTFNKNVVNLTVTDNNSRCFHLMDGRGTGVAIKIIFPDDQLRKEYREHVFIVPLNNLAPNAEYTLCIDSTLKAKNTHRIDGAHRIVFTTGTAAAASSNASLEDLADDVVVFTSSLPAAESLSSGPEAVGTASRPLSVRALSFLIIGAVLAAVAVFFVLLLFVGRKNNRSNQP